MTYSISHNPDQLLHPRIRISLRCSQVQTFKSINYVSDKCRLIRLRGCTTDLILYSKTCVREPPSRLTLNSGWCGKSCLSYKGTCHVILLAKLHNIYLYKTTTFPHQPLRSVSKVAVLNRFYCNCIWYKIIFSMKRIKCNKPQRQKTYFWTCVPRETSDQPAHSRSLIGIFTGRILDSQGCKVFSCRKSRLWSDCVDAQAKFESLLDANARRYVFSRCGSNEKDRDHWDDSNHITKPYLYNFDPLKPYFYIVKTGVYGDIHHFSYFCSKT